MQDKGLQLHKYLKKKTGRYMFTQDIIIPDSLGKADCIIPPSYLRAKAEGNSPCVREPRQQVWLCRGPEEGAPRTRSLCWGHLLARGWSQKSSRDELPRGSASLGS